jgi:hypothetical protein
MSIPRLEIKGSRSLVLLAPTGACLRPFSGPIQYSSELHTDLTIQLQQLRGRVYLEDGAIRKSELKNGCRHVSELDAKSWHLLTISSEGTVLGCTRFRQYPNTVSWNDLSISRAPLANSATWGWVFRACLSSELQSARRAGFSYMEIGGWALAPEIRATAEALKSVLAIYALGSLQGGALGISTATQRNGSSSILRRLGGRPLDLDGFALPPYYDDHYRCGMEMLRFDSRFPSPKYADAIHGLRTQMAEIPVICPALPQVGWTGAGYNLNFIPVLNGLLPPVLSSAAA